MASSLIEIHVPPLGILHWPTKLGWFSLTRERVGGTVFSYLHPSTTMQSVMYVQR